MMMESLETLQRLEDIVKVVNLYKPEWDLDFYPRNDEQFVRMVEEE